MGTSGYHSLILVQQFNNRKIATRITKDNGINTNK